MAELELRWTRKFTCPRRVENGMVDPNSPFVGAGADLDEWRVREDPEHPGLINTGMPACSYCGSLSPEFFLERVEEGWEVGPTDKNYKAYLKNPSSGPEGKFYFMHLDEEQKRTFIELYNEKKMAIGYPGHFYKKPYFCQ